MVPTVEPEVRTLRSSVCSGTEGTIIVTSIKPRTRRLIRDVKSVRSRPSRIADPPLLKGPLGLISNRLFPDRLRYFRLWFQFQFQSYGQFETLYLSELLPTSRMESLETFPSSAGRT